MLIFIVLHACQNDSDILISSFLIDIDFIVLGGLLEGTISLTIFNTKVFLIWRYQNTIPITKPIRYKSLVEIE